jgi:hypothetical protein
MGVDQSTIHQALLELHRAMRQYVYSMIAENTRELGGEGLSMVRFQVCTLTGT